MVGMTSKVRYFQALPRCGVPNETLGVRRLPSLALYAQRSQTRRVRHPVGERNVSLADVPDRPIEILGEGQG